VAQTITLITCVLKGVKEPNAPIRPSTLDRNSMIGNSFRQPSTLDRSAAGTLYSQ
jgi:hypothetical protein